MHIYIYIWLYNCNWCFVLFRPFIAGQFWRSSPSQRWNRRRNQRERQRRRRMRIRSPNQPSPKRRGLRLRQLRSKLWTLFDASYGLLYRPCCDANGSTMFLETGFTWHPSNRYCYTRANSMLCSNCLFLQMRGVSNCVRWVFLYVGFPTLDAEKIGANSYGLRWLLRCSRI